MKRSRGQILRENLKRQQTRVGAAMCSVQGEVIRYTHHPTTSIPDLSIALRRSLKLSVVNAYQVPKAGFFSGPVHRPGIGDTTCPAE